MNDFSAGAVLASPQRVPARCDHAPAAAHRTIASPVIEVLDDLAAAEIPWRALAATGVGTPYQRYDWAAAFAGAMGGAVRVLLLRSPAGQPLLLLPLALHRRLGLQVASCLGGKHANYHGPLMAPGIGDALAGAPMRAILEEAGRRMGVDAFDLRNLPLDWAGERNPIALGTAEPSPSDGYRLRLPGDPEEAIARAYGRESRKKLRKKERMLADSGAVVHQVARTPTEVEAILAAFHAQKAERFRAMGIADPFADPTVRAFLREACLRGLPDAPAVELHALLLREQVIAVFAGAGDAHRLCGMVNSFDTNPEIARCSPGDLLLAHVIRHCCRMGRDLFDLGVGEARYKSSICDEVERLVDVMVPVSPAGGLYAAAATGLQRAKRRIKQSPRLWGFVTSVRQLRGKHGLI